MLCWPKGAEKPDVSTVLDYLNDQGTTPPVVSGNVVNGYAIPENTDLKIAPNDYYKNSGSIVFWINLKTGNLQQQYADAQNIISQTVDQATTAEAIDYAKQMQDPILSPTPVDWPPTKTFNASNNMAVRVGAGGGYSIVVDIWSTK